jgi:hypothetical protein
VDTLREQLPWHSVQVRATARGTLGDPFAVRRVWTVHAGEALEEWLVMREEAHGKHSYALCNASRETSLEPLAWWKCQRYFIERSNQDAKSELGWDELQAHKYQAWEHHLALTVLALCWPPGSSHTPSTSGRGTMSVTRRCCRRWTPKCCLRFRSLMCARCCGR